MNSVKQAAVTEMLTTRYAKNGKGCWLWTGQVGQKGYGFISAVHGIKTRTYTVYRLSYEHFKGKITFRMCVRHKCHERRCYNPDHLILGTFKENSDDMIQAGRASWQIKKRRAKRAADFIPIQIMDTLAEKVLHNENRRRPGTEENRAAQFSELLAGLAKAKAMPWTRADKLKLAADIAAEVEREEVE